MLTVPLDLSIFDCKYIITSNNIKPFLQPLLIKPPEHLSEFFNITKNSLIAIDKTFINALVQATEYNQHYALYSINLELCIYVKSFDELTVLQNELLNQPIQMHECFSFHYRKCLLISNDKNTNQPYFTIKFNKQDPTNTVLKIENYKNKKRKEICVELSHMINQPDLIEDIKHTVLINLIRNLTTFQPIRWSLRI